MTQSLACSRLRDSWAAELRKGEDEGKTGGNWGEKGQVRVILGFFPGIFNAVFL